MTPPERVECPCGRGDATRYKTPIIERVAHRGNKRRRVTWKYRHTDCDVGGHIVVIDGQEALRAGPLFEENARVLPGRVAQPGVAVTDGGRPNKYVVATGPGYLGVHAVGGVEGSPEACLSGDETAAVGIEPGQRASVSVDGDRLYIGTNGSLPGESLPPRGTSTDPQKRGSIPVPVPFAAPGDDVRVYQRDDRLVVVPRDDDPFVGAE